jgi:acetyltransferase EpsM
VFFIKNDGRNKIIDKRGTLMDIAIIGEGRHSEVIQEMILDNENDKIVGYLDDHYVYIAFKDDKFFGPVSTSDKIIKFYSNLKFVVTIENNALRKLTVQTSCLRDKDYVSIIHKTAVISPSAVIGNGTVIMANATINANAKIGNHCIIHSGAVIERDCELSDFVHISPNVTLTDKVKISEGVHIGAGATVMPNTTIEEWGVISADATEIDTIPKASIAVGVPAKVKLNKVVGGKKI